MSRPLHPARPDRKCSRKKCSSVVLRHESDDMSQHCFVKWLVELGADQAALSPSDMGVQRSDVTELDRYLGADFEDRKLVEEPATCLRNILDPDIARPSLPFPVRTGNAYEMSVFAPFFHSIPSGYGLIHPMRREMVQGQGGFTRRVFPLAIRGRRGSEREV